MTVETRLSDGDLLPGCMMPDGAEPCTAFQRLEYKNKLAQKALRHAHIDMQACIAMIEMQGNGDTCEGLRQTLSLIEGALVP